MDWDDRITQLHEKLPRIFGNGSSILYVGAREDRIEAVLELREKDTFKGSRRIDLLEVWPENAEYFRSNEVFDLVISGDVRCPMPRGWHYNIAMWWHGPEHVLREELPGALSNLESLADLVILACPWGKFPQGVMYGNPYEAHASYLYQEDFEKLGYRTATLGTVDT